ncbi:4Fe-4S cluster-binding domain-containing protein [Clostridium sp.]|uniref:4Fe-4S cluster-binding domain-containing protein n=1 Tax=Clostridium sp. TaxID=1506 RepID=UPI0025839B9F|nr:4Fe-4S cluster-binding domain-containing protein [Clostridium sp.]MDF2504969.1 anaerobic ribonucleoside-triphosphate reductase activating protein [Clostridium sp.]
MSNNKIRLAGMIYESLSNGPGLRRVLFSQGCKHNCKSCFNSHTHSFEGGELMDMDHIIEDIVNNPMLRGVTFSGGDPLEQAEKFAYIARRVKENYVDVLIDGKFDIDKKDEKLKFRGSTNQRIIDIKKSLITGEVCTINC